MVGEDLEEGLYHFGSLWGSVCYVFLEIKSWWVIGEAESCTVQ